MLRSAKSDRFLSSDSQYEPHTPGCYLDLEPAFRHLQIASLAKIPSRLQRMLWLNCGAAGRAPEVEQEHQVVT